MERHGIGTQMDLIRHLLQGSTQAPPKLAERDLIALMERHGIGTDATVAEHIQVRLLLVLLWLPSQHCPSSARLAARASSSR